VILYLEKSFGVGVLPDAITPHWKWGFTKECQQKSLEFLVERKITQWEHSECLSLLRLEKNWQKLEDIARNSPK